MCSIAANTSGEITVVDACCHALRAA